MGVEGEFGDRPSTNITAVAVSSSVFRIFSPDEGVTAWIEVDVAILGVVANFGIETSYIFLFCDCAPVKWSAEFLLRINIG